MKALIVDDEARVRKAVRLLVDWERHGIDEILEAGGGKEAAELIAAHKPALVIMDMMMGAGHGIELMGWVDEYADNTKFIVVSGHDDFEFVRQTVRHGGIDYILKPIEAEAINLAVGKAMAAWRSEEEERSQKQRQNIRLNEIKPIYGEKLLSALIDDPAGAEGSLRRLIAEGVVPEGTRQARLVLIQTDSAHNPLLKRFGGDSDLLHYAVVNVCNEFLQPQRLGVAFRYWGGPAEIGVLLWQAAMEGKEFPQGRMAAGTGSLADAEGGRTAGTDGLAAAESSRKAGTDRLAAAESSRTAKISSPMPVEGDGLSDAQAAELVGRINNGLYLALRQRMHFGISASGALPEALPRQKMQAAQALRKRNLLLGEQYGHFLPSPDAKGDAQAPAFALVQEQWKTAVLSGSREALEGVAERWTQELARYGFVSPETMNRWKADILTFRSRLVREAMSGHSGEILAELEQDDARNLAPGTGGYGFSLFAWRDWSLELLSRLAQALAARAAKEKSPLADILAYIDHNYPSDLSLQEVAGRFFVSREYVSRKFKQEHGINFSDYVANVRIEKAKLLLQNPHLKLSQIAEMVGIHDVKYFSKVFKKQTGLTPNDYRKQAAL